MKFEVTVTKGKKDNDKFTATITSGALVGKDKVGTDVSAEDIGDRLAELINKADSDGLIGKK